MKNLITRGLTVQNQPFGAFLRAYTFDQNRKMAVTFETNLQTFFTDSGSTPLVSVLGCFLGKDWSQVILEKYYCIFIHSCQLLQFTEYLRYMIDWSIEFFFWKVPRFGKFCIISLKRFLRFPGKLQLLEAAITVKQSLISRLQSMTLINDTDLLLTLNIFSSFSVSCSNSRKRQSCFGTQIFFPHS